MKKHLPLYGIGPALCYSMALVTAVCIWLANKGCIPWFSKKNRKGE